MEIATREALINECDFVKGALLCEFFEEKDEGRKIVIKKKIDVIWKFSDKARKALATEEDEKKIISFLRKIRKRT
jgi:hypothetical protein